LAVVNVDVDDGVADGGVLEADGDGGVGDGRC